MTRRPIGSMAEYGEIALRRWVWILVPATLIAGLTIVIARKLPKVYSSEALILVEPQKVPADFVKPTVSNNIALGLESIEEQILSRTQLSQIIDKYGLYKGRHLGEDAEVTLMQSDIKVTTEVDADQRDAQVTAFRIAYQGRDAALTQQVTRELSSLFITENLKARAQQSEGTESFIDGRLTDANQQLQTLEGQLRDLKNTYMGSLPEQQGANLQVLAQLQAVSQADLEALARAQQQKVYLTSLGQAVSQLGNEPPAPPSQAELDLHKAQSDLAIAQQQYTPLNPDVIRLTQQVKALTGVVAAAAAADKASAKAADATPAGLQPEARGQIALLDQEIQLRTAEQKQTQAKIAAMQARIEQLPEVEEKLSSLQNAYDEAKTNDAALLEKKAAASMAAAMEQQAEGEEFRIMDPANLPQKPASPNLLRIDLLGALAGILIGLGLGWLAEARHHVVRREADLEFYAGVPTLAVLPLRPRLQAAPAAGGGEGG